MVLIDTNIIIDYWHGITEKLDEIITYDSCCVCGVVRSELIRGAVSEKDVDRIISALSEFHYVDFEPSDWDELGKMIFNLRTHGISVPLPDAIISYLAIKNTLPLLTDEQNDAHLRHTNKPFTVSTPAVIYSRISNSFSIS